MLRLILQALCLFELIRICSGYDAPCTSTEYIKYSCYRNVIIAIDSEFSGHVKHRVEKLIATSIIQQLDIAFGGTHVGLATFGEHAATINYFSHSKIFTCELLESLWSYRDETDYKDILRMMEHIYHFYNYFHYTTLILIISDSSSQYDIDEAGGILERYISEKKPVNFSSVVINLAPERSFHKWLKHTDVYTGDFNYSHEHDINDFVQRIESAKLPICDELVTRKPRPTTTTIEPTTTTTQPTTTTTEPTTTTTQPTTTTEEPTTTTTLPATTTTEPTSLRTSFQYSTFSTTHTTPRRPGPQPTPTGLPVASIENTGCTCVPETVWLDVFLLMDASLSMTSDGIASATDYIVSAFDKLTIGQAERFQTRLGVIRYADSVELIADLSDYTSTADLLDLDISIMNEIGTNIEGAIHMATSKFLSPSHRAAARPVLIIVASSYRDGGYNDPTQIANEFRADGGAIITIEYLQEHGVSIPILQKIASPNFSLTNTKSDGTELDTDELRQLLCEANCFCKKNWIPYKINGRKSDAPHGGCYYRFPMSSIQKRANHTCFRRKDATLVLDEDSEKDAFLTETFPPKTKLWLGLLYKDSQWTWPGGYSTGFTNWAWGQPDYQTGNCAYMQINSGSKSEWFTDNCNNDHHYICQTKPCDSTKYCPAE